MNFTWPSVESIQLGRSIRPKLTLSILVAIATCAGTAFATEDDAPLVLSSRHIGMSSEQIAADSKAVQHSEANARAVELSSQADHAEARALSAAEELAEIEAALAAAQLGAGAMGIEQAAVASEWQSEPAESTMSECPAVSGTEGGISGFEGCLETSIRGGNGYEESSRICRSLFPDSA